MTAQSPFLSEQTGHGQAAPAPDTGGSAPMPKTSFIPPKSNGNGQYRENPSTPDFPRDSQAEQNRAITLGDLFRALRFTKTALGVLAVVLGFAGWLIHALWTSDYFNKPVLSNDLAAVVASQKTTNDHVATQIDTMNSVLAAHTNALGSITISLNNQAQTLARMEGFLYSHPAQFPSPPQQAASAPLAPQEVSQAPLSPRPAAISPKKIQAAKKPLQAPAPKSFLCSSAGIGC